MFSRNIVVTKGVLMSVKSLYELYKSGKLIFNAEYQRSYVWNLPKKQLLIDSILRGYDIGTIFLRLEKEGVYECLDGQQRLRSIFDFIENKYRLNPSYTPWVGKKLFRELDEGLKRAILSYPVVTTVISGSSDEETSDIFLRLQEGMPLNKAEKLNAIGGYMRKAIVRLSKHPLMRVIGVKPYRFTHRYILAQAVYLELKGATSGGKEIKDVRVSFGELKEMYLKFRDVYPPVDILGRVRNTLNFIYESMGGRASIIKGRTDFLAVYLVASYLLGKYERERIEDFGEKVANFFLNLHGVEGNNVFSCYKRARKAAKKGHLAKPANVMLAWLLKELNLATTPP